MSSRFHCPAPHNEIVITSQGEVAPCCVYQGSRPHISNLLVQPTRKTDKLFNDLNEIFEAVAIPLGCRPCFEREKHGLISKRQKLLRRQGEGTSPGQHVEISLSNSCNLDCVMCTSLFSTKLERVHRLFSKSKDPILKNHHTPYLNRAKAYALSLDETEKLAMTLPQLESLEIIGGEPMLFKHISQFFKTLIRIGNLPRRLLFVTNGTSINHELCEVLSTFTKTKIQISISMDGLGNVYNYIRGHSFEDTEKNVQFYISQPWVSELFIKPTFSFINFHQLALFYPWMEDLKSQKVDLLLDQFLHVHEPLSATCLPLHLREDYIDSWIRSPFYANKNKKRIDDAIAQLKSYPEPTQEIIDSTLENIRVLDEHRRMSLFDLSEELKRIKQFFTQYTKRQDNTFEV